MRHIYIVSPCNVATGGTELLQQLCFNLNKLGQKAYMFYTQSYDGSAVQKRFEPIYGNLRCSELNDQRGNIIVFPETEIGMSHKIKNASVYFWWLSVDNYFGASKAQFSLPRKLFNVVRDWKNTRLFRKNINLVQSEYAHLYLLGKQVSENNILRLSDYLSSSYLKAAQSSYNCQRDNVILYNPKKGYEFTKKLIDAIPEYKWIPLQGYTPTEMADIMKRSKIYVDFGNHPGKDRIPREACICGCCIITGTRGAAGNEKDVPIGSEFKFDDNEENIYAIKRKIDYCMKYYEEESKKQDVYREIICGEEDEFLSDICCVFIDNSQK